MTSARRYYRFSLALGGVGVLTLLLAVAAVPYALSPSVPTVGELTEACRRLVLVISVPAITVTVLASLGVASAACALRTGWRHGHAQRALRRRLCVIDRLHAGGLTAELFVAPDAQAFCAGLYRPRVYVSTGAVDMLDRGELEAVLAHETHHATRRDPFRILLSRVLRDALFFLPIMRHVTDRYGGMAEMAADEAAVRHCGDPAPLASAMLTFEQGAPSGSVGIAPERVDHLLGQHPRWQLPVVLLGAGLATLTAIALLGAATALAVPSGGLSMAMLVAQLCAFAMALAPPAGVAALVLTVRRGLGRRLAAGAAVAPSER